MADYFTHYFLGTKVLEKVNFSNINEKIFLLGCQGPDIFYYERYAVETIPPNLGQLMHESLIRKSFFEIFSFLKQNNSIELKSYILGLVAHYILDKNIHPYIDSKKSFDHKRLEANIDTYIIDKYLNKSIFEMNSDKILDLDFKKDNIFLCYKNISNKVYNSKLSLKQFNKGINNFSFFHKIFNCKNPLLRGILKKIILLFNRKMEKYFYLPINKIRLPKDIDEVDSIIFKSIDEVISIFNRIKKYLNNEINIDILMNEIDEINYSGI